MTTTYLTANDLKNLNHLGNPGEFSQEAYDFINDFGDVDTEATEFWTDFMKDRDGAIFAVAADGPIGSSCEAVRVELEDDDQWEGADAIRLSA